MVRLALAALLALAGCAPVSAATPAWTMRQYTTGNSSELITELPVTLVSGAQKRAMFCLDLQSPPTGGEILLVTADAAVTNDLGYDTSFISHLVLSPSCDFLDGTEICEAQGGNTTPMEHHKTANRAGSITVAPGNSRRFVVMVVWAASTKAQPGHSLRVDRDYGRMSVIRHTPV